MERRKKFNLSAIETALVRERDRREAYHPEAKEAVLATAVRATFDPEAVTDAEDRDFLSANSYTVAGGGRVLHDEVRERILTHLFETERLEAYYTRYAAPLEAESLLQRTYGQALFGRLDEIAEDDEAALNAYLRVAPWAYTVNTDLPDPRRVEGLLHRLSLLRHFRAQTAHFAGREEELKALSDYVYAERPAGDGFADHPPLLIYGIGGVGKSTLVAQFLLAALEKGSMPYVYLDFDRVGLSLASPLQLAAEGLRQLSAQFPQDNVLATALESLEYYFSDEARMTKSGIPDDRTGWLLDRHLTDRVAAALPPVLITLDSFEEAQFRATESELRNLLDFLDRLRRRMPSLRLLIVGRSDLVVRPFDFTPLAIGDFDRSAAAGFLRGRKITDKQVADEIYEKVGGNPLNLRLAAELYRETGDLSGLGGERIREQLVRRNLAHVRGDDDLRQLALPGLLLRRINPEIIREVMAGPCGLGEISLARAGELFDQLRRVTFLIEEGGDGSIQFRRDLRLALKDQLWASLPTRATNLHVQARRYHRELGGPVHQAEYIFHHAQLNQDLNKLQLDTIDWEVLRPYLENALPELPPQPAAYLSRMLGVRLPPELLDRVDAEEQAEQWAAKVADALENATAGEDLLREYWKEQEGLPGRSTDFVYYRRLLAIRLGHHSDDTLEQPGFIDAKVRTDQWYLTLLAASYAGNFDLAFSLYAHRHFKSELHFRSRRELTDTLFRYAKSAGLAGEEFSPAAVVRTLAHPRNLSLLKQRSKRRAANLPLRLADLKWEALETLSRTPLDAPIVALDHPLFVALNAIRDAYQGRGDQFEKTYQAVVDADGDRLSLVLQNVCGRTLSEVAPAGVREVQAHDVVDFLVAFYAGEWGSVGDFVERINHSIIGDASDYIDISVVKKHIKSAYIYLKEEQLYEAISEFKDLAIYSKEEKLIDQILSIESRHNNIEKQVEERLMTLHKYNIEKSILSNRIEVLISHFKI